MSISSVSSSSSSSYNSTEIQVQKSKLEKSEQSQQTGNSTEVTVSKSKTIETKSSSDDSSAIEISAHGDTVEISKQGKIKAQSMSESPNNVSKDLSDGNETTSAEISTVQALSSDDSDNADNAVNTANLSQYTEYELKQMLSEGTISSSEYDNEVERREKGTESCENDSNAQQDINALE